MKNPACGNRDCSVSTGICGSITYGSGYLDANGYWDWPCEVCTKANRLRDRNIQVAADLRVLKASVAVINRDPLEKGCREHWGNASYALRNDLIYLAELGLQALEKKVNEPT